MAKHLEGGRTGTSSEGVKPSLYPRTTPFAFSPDTINKHLSQPLSDAIARLPRVRITFTSSEVHTHQGTSAEDTLRQICIDRVSSVGILRGRLLPQGSSPEEIPTTTPPALKRHASLQRGRWSDNRIQEQADPISQRDKTTRPEATVSAAQPIFDEVLHLVHEQIVTDPLSTVHTTLSGLTIVERKPPEPSQADTVISDILAHVRPSEKWQTAHQYMADRVLPIFAERFSVESPREQLDAKVAELVQDVEFCTRLSPKSLAQVLQDGRMKSMFETRTSTGRMTFRERAKLEYNLFSYPMDLPPEQRTSYGHLADNSQAQSLDLFNRGSAIIVWKKQVNSRVTFTMGDSGGLGTGRTSRGYPLALPVSLDNPGMQALDLSMLLHRNPLTWRSLADVQTFADGQIYAEGQLHGGNAVREEASHLIFRNPTEILSHPQVLELAFKYNIPCFLDFSHRFKLERELDSQYESLSEALTAEYGYKIQTVRNRRQYSPLFENMSMQGRRLDIQQYEKTTVQIVRE